MTGLQVSELARRAGVAPSTVRFYERLGLLSPARRGENGYRVFDEAAVDELAFVGRAKGIGMSLEDIADLLAVWPNGECRSLQARLRSFLSERIDKVHEQLTDLEAFERQLQMVLGRLAARDPGPERCGKGCGCETDLDTAAEDRRADFRPWGCTLGAGEFEGRVGEWRSAAQAATSFDRVGTTARLAFPADLERARWLAQLCVAEVSCCADTRFVMEIDSDQIVVTFHAPDAPELLGELFLVDLASKS